MSDFFDNLCRTLATPMPRSRALKLIVGGLAGACERLLGRPLLKKAIQSSNWNRRPLRDVQKYYAGKY